MAKTIAEAERQAILDALRDSRGRVNGPLGAAKILGISLVSFRRRMATFNITRQEVSALIQPAMKETEEKTFVEKRQERIEQITRNRGERIYGSINYIAKHVFRSEENMVGYARMVAEDGDTRFQAFIEAWDINRASLMPKDAQTNLTTLVKDSGINSIDFCVEVMRACMKRNIEISNIYAGLAHPSVVKTNIKNALKMKGVKDREMFLQHSGWLPLPKGSTVNVNAQAASGTLPGMPGPVPIGEPTERTALPEFEEATVEGSKIVRREFEDGE